MELQIKTLLDHPEMFDKVLALIEKELGYQAPDKFRVDFYPLVAQSNWRHCHLLLKDNQLIGHIGVRLIELGDEYRLPVAFLGGICISKESQGVGHLKYFLNHILSLYQNQIAFFMLWSHLSELYQKFDFYEAGSIVQTGDQSFIKAPSYYKETRLDQLSESDFNHVKDLYQKMGSYQLMPRRSSQDWDLLQEIKSAQLYLSDEHYFIINKGYDLKQIIHEFGSKNPQKFLNEIGHHKVWTSPSLSQGHNAQVLFLAHFKIANEDILKKFLLKRSRDQLEIISIKQQIVEFKLRGQISHFGIQDFLHFILNDDPRHGLKLNIYISGLDSV